MTERLSPAERFEREEQDGAAETSAFIELLDAEARDRLRDAAERQVAGWRVPERLRDAWVAPRKAGRP